MQFLKLLPAEHVLTGVISQLSRLKQEDPEFEASLSYFKTGAVLS
jgi:hypothetical protein